MKIGCPAISIRGKKAVVDTTLCIGCGVCTQMCRFGAFEGGTGEKDTAAPGAAASSGHAEEGKEKA
jgi:TPP-dependent indolepyruvate ferredoxin oxidoreductase alpha subunit